jgi:heme o synthase
MSSRAESLTGARDLSNTLVGLVQLTKPAVSRMVMVTTLCGAVAAPGAIDLGRLLWTLVATALVVAAANVLNMYLERDVDALMERTKQRPLPAGKLAPEVALWFGVLLVSLGIGGLVFFVSQTCAALAAVAFVIYVAVYTPLKRVTPFALHVGAIPGAIPPLIGWASVSGTIDSTAILLGAILLVWQLPHFIAISMFRREDYAAAGFPVYSVVRGPTASRRAVIATTFGLVVLSLLPATREGVGVGYLAFASAAGLGFLALALRRLGDDQGRRWARHVFFASLPYLVGVYGALMLDLA